MYKILIHSIEYSIKPNRNDIPDPDKRNMGAVKWHTGPICITREYRFSDHYNN